MRREDAQVVGVVGRPGGHHPDALALGEAPVDHAHQHDDADIGVEPAVDDHGAQRAVGIAARRRHAGHHRLQDLVDPHASLGRARDGVARVDADHVLDLGAGVVRVGLRQVHLVQDRHHLDAEVERGVAVGHGLRLDALAGVDHQQRALAGRQRAADLVGKIDVAGRVDQVEVVDLPVARLVVQRGGLRLDGDAALALDVHRVEQLGFHLALGQAAAALDQAIRQRRLAMVDVRDDREISDVVHREKRFNARPPGWRAGPGRQQKRARPQETRPEPTSNGNCSSWEVIVGKTRGGYTRRPHLWMSCTSATFVCEQVINRVVRPMSGQLVGRLWSAGGLLRGPAHPWGPEHGLCRQVLSMWRHSNQGGHWGSACANRSRIRH